MTNITSFLSKVLLEYEESMRRTGRITRIAKKAKETGSIMVCHNHSFAQMIVKEFGITTVSIDRYLDIDYSRGKRNVSHVFDHFVEYEIIQRKLKEVESFLNRVTLTMGSKK